MAKRSRHVINKMSHFQKRAQQRCGFKLTTIQIKYIVDSIRNGTANFVSRYSKYISKWRIFVEGEYYYVVYNRRHGVLVTIYPEFD